MIYIYVGYIPIGIFLYFLIGAIVAKMFARRDGYPRLDHYDEAVVTVFWPVFGPGFLVVKIVTLVAWVFDSPNRRRAARAKREADEKDRRERAEREATRDAAKNARDGKYR